MVTDDALRTLLRLIARRDGDSEAAMAQFYRALSGSVLAFVQQRIDGAQDAEAVVVDTMYEVWRVASSFDAQSQVRTWVLGIARHKLIDAMRRGGRHRHEDIDDHAEALEDTAPGALQQLADRQQAEWVAQCMARLGDDHRESLHLLFFEGLSVREIAEVQQVPEGTVKTRVFHAKKKIQACLARWLAASGELLGTLAGRPEPPAPQAPHG